MAKPVEFSGQTHVLGPPEGMTEQDCGLLPVRHDDGVITSCWQLSAAEQAEMLLTGRIYVQVMSGSTTQPPIAVSTERPFR